MSRIAEQTPNARRRVVLVDFDWQDADLIPQLIKHPDLAVRLVAGERAQDPGVRVAEMCGLPRTLDLADLTREIFDVALVSERSSRRSQLESLLLALGTPAATPQSYLRGQEPPPPAPAIDAPLAVHAAAFEHAMGGGDFDQLMEQALPDLGARTVVHEAGGSGLRGRPPVVATLDDFPSPEVRSQLESVLRDLVSTTGAGAAEVYVAESDQTLQLIAQVGPEDRLLKGLVDLASELGTPQVVTRLSEPEKGRSWGAWPFKTTQRKGVIAAAGIAPGEGWTRWQNMVEDLRNTWDAEDRERVVPSFPLSPGLANGLLPAEDFRVRIELAVERNRRDALRFELHRLEFPAAGPAADALCSALPGQLRETDALCRVAAARMLVLVAGGAEGYHQLRRRLLAEWDQAWRQHGSGGATPAIVDQYVDMVGPEDQASFMSVASGWLDPSAEAPTPIA